MNSSERVLTLRIDDTQLKDAIKKMQNVSIGGASSSSTPKGITGIAKMLTNNSGILKTVAKLTLILAAITVIVKLITKITDRIIDSSPILQTMLKLFQTSITFILRPIGDFIAFFLRPFLIYFLRSVALPMYRLFSPIARSLGTFLSGNLLGSFMLNYDPDTDPFFGTTGIFTDIGKKFTAWKTELGLLVFPTFTNIGEKFVEFKEHLTSLKLPSFSSIVLGFIKFVDHIVNLVFPILASIGNSLPYIFKQIMIIFDKVMPVITPLIKKIIDQIMELLKSILPHTDTISKIIETVFIGLTAFFIGLNILLENITWIIRVFFPEFAKVRGVSEGYNTTISTTNVFGDYTSQEDYNRQFGGYGFEMSGSEIEKSINISRSGRRS